MAERRISRREFLKDAFIFGAVAATSSLVNVATAHAEGPTKICTAPDSSGANGYFWRYNPSTSRLGLINRSNGVIIEDPDTILGSLTPKQAKVLEAQRSQSLRIVGECNRANRPTDNVKNPEFFDQVIGTVKKGLEVTVDTTAPDTNYDELTQTVTVNTLSDKLGTMVSTLVGIGISFVVLKYIANGLREEEHEAEANYELGQALIAQEAQIARSQQEARDNYLEQVGQIPTSDFIEAKFLR